jgi:hypothetical protein
MSPSEVFAFSEPAMRLQSPPESPAAFVSVPVELLNSPLSIDWRQTEELYRLALERAQFDSKPTIVNRLAPYWD